jgi:hypothetical protein
MRKPLPIELGWAGLAGWTGQGRLGLHRWIDKCSPPEMVAMAPRNLASPIERPGDDAPLREKGG